MNTTAMTDPNQAPSPFLHKAKPGVKRWFAAFRYSITALHHGWKHETAMREELLLAIVAIPTAFFLADAVWKALLMISAVLFVLLIEAINTAIETLTDRISTELHPLSKIAKDMGSLAVLLAVIIAAFIWMALLIV
jgi:diacylglycerol kinase (ATP)